MRSSLRYVLLSTAILALTSAAAPAQEADGTIEFLEGGSLSSDCYMSLGFLYGAGSRPDGLGSQVSTVRAGVACVSGNPAGLASLRGEALLVDILPPLGASASEILDIEGAAADAIDDAIDDYTTHGFEPGYPTFSTDVGQPGGVISGVFGGRMGRIVAGVAIEEPMAIGLELVDTGLEVFGETSKEEGDDLVDIQLRCMGDAAADLTFGVTRTTLAAASDITSDVSMGLSLSRYHGSAELSAVLRADGIVDYGGQEYAFNDPSAPWYNELGATAKGSYAGDAFGWSIGASWRPTDHITVDAAYMNMPRLTMTGSLTTVENTMPGLTDGDYDLDQILDSQPTLTERTETVEDDPFILCLPSYAGLAVSMRAPFVLGTLEYRRYSGSFGFEYQDISEGVDVTDGVGLELDFGGLVLGGGVIRGTLLGESIDEGSAGDDILIPLANVGLGIDIGQNMRLDTMLIAVPLQVMRMTLGYDF